MFKKVIIRKNKETTEECSINTDMIIMIEPCSTEKVRIFDDSIYMTRVWLNIDGKTTDITGPIQGRDFCIPVPCDLVEKYLNNEITFDEIKNYKIPKVEAPERLEEWVEMARYSRIKAALRTIIRQGITTKSQLLNMTWSQVQSIRGVGKEKLKFLQEMLDCFGLPLKEEK